MKKTYHFIGLGGIGMSALARILLQMGHRVRGSDTADSALLEQLRKEGAFVQIGHSKEAIQKGACVVYSSGIAEENEELVRAREIRTPLLHRADLLSRLMEEKRALFVAGSHGKTTTTALLAAALLEAGFDPSFAIGGILSSLGTNGRAGKGDFFVAEADESDGSFLKGTPFGAIVTNIGDDHLNYWGTQERLDAAFGQFLSGVISAKHLFWCGDEKRLKAWEPKRGFSYGFSDGVDLRLSSYVVEEKGISFDVQFEGARYEKVELSLFGRHNALNGAAVFGLCLALGIPEGAIRKAFASFSGTKRRLEWKAEVQRISVYDDYGHHPREIAATLKALRERVKERRLVALFQPHRYTRARDLSAGFSQCFDEADIVLLTDIYGAGEAPIENVTSAALYRQMREALGEKLFFAPRAELEERAAKLLAPLDAVVAFGAGDITRAIEPLLHCIARSPPRLRVGVLCGGTSVEHDVSLISARNISCALDPAIYEVMLFGITKRGGWFYGPDVIDRLQRKDSSASGTLSSEVLQELFRCDVCIPVFHGPQGEDGMVQGLLDALQIPYVGCDYRAAALCMHKGWTKQVALFHNVPTARYIEMSAVEYARDPNALLKRIAENLRYPVWIKPVHLGSSIGVTRVVRSEEVLSAAEAAFALDDVLIAEEEVVGRQIEFAVLGNEWIRIAAPCEILLQGVFYSYEEKYGSHPTGVQIPANITPVEREIGYELAKKMYLASGCKGMARIDFFLDRNGYFWLNEINPFPGFTAASGYPLMWEASGLRQPRLCDELIALALHKSRRLAQIRGK